MRIVAGYKVCTKCRENKPVSEYFKDRQKAAGIRPDCKDCNKAKSLAWAQANPDKRKGYMTKHLYGIDSIRYAEMLAEQADCCAICGREQSEFSKAFAVDHCHKTGRVRGLLCSNCNTALGKFGDSIHTVISAMEYLRIHNVS